MNMTIYLFIPIIFLFLCQLHTFFFFRVTHNTQKGISRDRKWGFSVFLLSYCMNRGYTKGCLRCLHQCLILSKRISAISRLSAFSLQLLQNLAVERNTKESLHVHLRHR